MISASLVKELREKSGAGMLDCKKALDATNGNIDEAVNWLREKGISKAAKIPTFEEIDGIKEKITGIKEIKLVKENEDKTKQYEITGENDVNLNKTIFNEFAKENITIFEMKKTDTTLEDAFMKLIEGGVK